jgi:hypothetical protein
MITHDEVRENIIVMVGRRTNDTYYAKTCQQEVVSNMKTGHKPNSATTSDDYKDVMRVRVVSKLCNYETHNS